MELRVITHPDFYDGEAEQINAMLKDGLGLIHIRKPKWTYDQIMSLLEEIHEFYHEHVVIHQMHDMGKEFGLAGVHLKSTERDRMNDEQLDEWLSQWKERGCKVSTAIHNMDEFDRFYSRFNLLTVSPVFESIMKPGYRSEIDWLRILKDRELSKVMAIGGVSVDTIRHIAKLNFGACGAMGAIWKEGIPFENYKKLKNICEQEVHSS
ncbi:MAG: thiamine phosphate synthase [Bacteroidota bacterium]